MTAAQPSTPDPRVGLVLEAIAKQRCVHGRYNGTASRMAPHVLYTRAGQLYLGAVVQEREGRPPRDRKLGIFKLDALRDLAITDHPFEPDAVFDPADRRFAETALFAVAA